MIVLYSATLFVSAALLFLVEPMVGKILLPELGGAPAVWITTLLFFQAALLAGYAYGHVLTTRLGPRRQTALHLALLAVALIVLPVAVHPGGRPPVSSEPVLWLLGVLALTVGLPFFVVAANGPLLARWLAGTRHRSAGDPYFLYAASNVGSIVGLLAYPVVLEPLLSLHAQTQAWAWGYAALLVLVAGCAVAVWRLGLGGVVAVTPGAELPAAAAAGHRGELAVTGTAVGAAGRGAELAVAGAAEHPPEPVSWARRARWVALAFVPSSFMLGTTTFITRDLAPVPLLWVIPLALYLASFVVAFARRRDPARLVRVTRLILPGVVIVVVYTMAIGSQRPLWLLLALHLAALLVAALMCHGALAANRPGATQVTDFYLWVALGGVLGGVFNALLAPVVFPTLIEYPVAIVAACLLRPPSPKPRPGILELITHDARLARVMDFTVPVLFGLILAAALRAVQSANGDAALTRRSLIFGLALGISVNFARRPLRFGLAIASIFLATTVGTGAGGQVLMHERTFFGIYRVDSDAGYHELLDGTTLHGVERIGGPSPPEPLSYYNRAGPAGQVFAALPDRALTDRVAVIGLGSGAMACYSRPGQRWTFYEIDPAIARIARDPRMFTYLRDCRGRFRVVLGDARRSLAAEPTDRYGAIVIDAFNSDAIPVHLLTRQALALYLRRLRPGGVLLFHISNRYVDLRPVLGAVAADGGLTCRVEHAEVTPDQARRRYADSTWVVMARGGADLGRVARERRWHACGHGARAWSDGYSSLLGLLRWG